jgi:hypothetical protein
MWTPLRSYLTGYYSLSEAAMYRFGEFVMTRRGEAAHVVRRVASIGQEEYLVMLTDGGQRIVTAENLRPAASPAPPRTDAAPSAVTTSAAGSSCSSYHADSRMVL